MKKIIGISAVVLAMALLAVKGLAVNVDASVTVPGTCGLSVTGGSSIAFGSVVTGTTSGNQTVNVKNTGSVPTNPAISNGFTVLGTHWTGGPGMDVGYTDVSDDDGSTWSALTLAAQQIYSGIVSNGATVNPQFQVSIPEGQAAASYSQTITFTASC